MLAARRAGIRHVILAEGNRKDLADVPNEARRGLSFHFVDDILDVLACALTNMPRPRSGSAVTVPTEPATVGV